MNTLFCRLFWGFVILMMFVGIPQLASAQKNKKKKKDQANEEVIYYNSSDNENAIEAEYYFIEGMKFFVLEKYAEALDNFKQALSLSSGAPSINFKIAETYFRVDDYPNAEQYAQKALEQDKENKFYYLLLAKIYQNQEKYRKTIEVYQKLTSSEIGAKEYYYDIASIYEQLKDYPKAIEYYDKFEQEFGISETLIVQKQKIYVQLQQIDQAIAEGEKLTQVSPDPKHRISLAELLIANGRIEAAQPILEEAINQESNDPRAYLLLGQIYRSQGKHKEAMAQLKQAFANPELEADTKTRLMLDYFKEPNISEYMQEFGELAQLIAEVHPDDVNSQLLYGDVLLNRGDQSAALNQYRQSIKVDENVQAKIWRQILALESERNEVDSLLKHATQALELYPNQAIFWLYSGLGNLQKGNYDEAVLACEEGKRLAFNDQELQNEFSLILGNAYHSLKQFQESDLAFEAVLKNDPENAQALNNYSFFLALRNDKLNLAKEMAAKLVDKYPENGNYLDTYGWVLYQAKEYKKARKQLEKAAQRSPSGAVLEHYGDVLFQLGEADNAVDQWTKAKELGGTSELIDKKITNRSLYE